MAPRTDRPTQKRSTKRGTAKRGATSKRKVTKLRGKAPAKIDKLGRKNAGGSSRCTITEPVVRKILRRLEDGDRVREACKEAGVNYLAFYRQLRKNDNLQERVTRAKGPVDDEVEEFVSQAARGIADPSRSQLIAAFFWLQNRRRERWKNRWRERETESRAPAPIVISPSPGVDKNGKTQPLPSNVEDEIAAFRRKIEESKSR